MERKTRLDVSSSSSPVSFLYRMKDRDIITDSLKVQFRDDTFEFVDQFAIALEVELDGKTPAEAIQAIKEYIEATDKNKKTPLIFDVAKLKDIQKSLSELLSTFPVSEKLSKDSKRQCKKLIKEQINTLVYGNPKIMIEVNNLAYKKSCELYFAKYFERQKQKPLDYSELGNNGKDGMLYCPPGGKHTWRANLEWLLGRLKSGSEFVIMSMITQQSKFRSTGLVGSGYFREIATCYKLGYRFVRQGNELKLIHPNPHQLRNLTLHDVTMSKEEMEVEFAKAVKDFEKLYIVDVQPGEVLSKPLDKATAEKLHKELLEADINKSSITITPLSGSNYSIKITSRDISQLRTATHVLGIQNVHTARGPKESVKGQQYNLSELLSRNVTNLDSLPIGGGEITTKRMDKATMEGLYDRLKKAGIDKLDIYMGEVTSSASSDRFDLRVVCNTPAEFLKVNEVLGAAVGSVREPKLKVQEDSSHFESISIDLIKELETYNQYLEDKKKKEEEQAKLATSMSLSPSPPLNFSQGLSSSSTTDSSNIGPPTKPPDPTTKLNPFS